MEQMPPAVAVIVFGIYAIMLFAMYIALAIANGLLAGRLGKSVAAWVILSLIPVVNVFFYIYMCYTVLFFIIDRLRGVAPVRTI